MLERCLKRKRRESSALDQGHRRPRFVFQDASSAPSSSSGGASPVPCPASYPSPSSRDQGWPLDADGEFPTEEERAGGTLWVTYLVRKMFQFEFKLNVAEEICVQEDWLDEDCALETCAVWKGGPALKEASDESFVLLANPSRTLADLDVSVGLRPIECLWDFDESVISVAPAADGARGISSSGCQAPVEEEPLDQTIPTPWPSTEDGEKSILEQASWMQDFE